MKTNYLSIYLDNLFEECTLISANLYVTNNLIKPRIEDLKKNFPIKDYRLMSMISTYRDLSKIGDDKNLFLTNKTYILNTDNLDFEINRILSYYSCLSISQALEVFESFLKDIISEMVMQNNELANQLKLQNKTFEFEDIRDSLRMIKEKNNKGFIKGIRELSPFFKRYEANNIWGINMTDWYKLIIEIRHVVVHQRQHIPKDFLDNLKSKGLIKLFERHFKLNNNTLFLNPNESNSIIDHLYEYAYLIFQGLSNDFDLDIRKYESL